MIRFERVSLSKIWRKIDSDGILDTIVAGLEFGSRRIVLKPLFVYSIRNGYTKTADVNALSTTRDPIEQYAVATRVSNGYVFTSTGLVADADGRLLLESISKPTAKIDYQAVVLIHHIFRDSIQTGLAIAQNNTSRLRKTAVNTDVVTPLIPRYTNYFHWLIETLPRLRYVEQYYHETGEKPSVLIPASATSWMRESLKLVIGDQFNICEANSNIYQPSVTIATPQARGSPADCQWIAERVYNQIRVNTGSSKNRIYVSRQNARERRVRNESEVVEMLGDYGFESHCLEEYSVAEQARLFANVEIVIAPHGAGLSNLVFSTDTTVVELFGSKIKDNFKQLSAARGLEYQAMYCEKSGTDLQVDITRLKNIVEEKILKE